MHTLMLSRDKKWIIDDDVAVRLRPKHAPSGRCRRRVHQLLVHNRHARASKIHLLSPCLLFALVDPNGVARQRRSTEKKNTASSIVREWVVLYTQSTSFLAVFIWGSWNPFTSPSYPSPKGDSSSTLPPSRQVCVRCGHNPGRLYRRLH